MHGHKIAWGGIDDANLTVLDCLIYCHNIKPVFPVDFAIPLGISSSICIQSVLPFVASGTMRTQVQG